jgi:fructokinase
MPEIVCLGEALIDVFAETGVPLRDASTLSPSPGGAPANLTVALARLRADVGFIGKVGVDEYGSYLIDLLKQEGIDTTYFVAEPGAPTMLAIVATPSKETPQFILYNGANAMLRIEELPKNYITSANIFIYGSVTLSNTSRDAALQAAVWAKAAGNHVIFDVNLRSLIWPNLKTAKHWINKGVANATILKLNEEELEFLTGEKDPEAGSDKLLQQSIQLCCVSLGSKGVFFNNGTFKKHVPAFAVKVVNTTGCGDAFVGGLAYGLNAEKDAILNLSEKSLTQMIRFANACGALAATKVDAMSGLSGLDEVKSLLNR